MRELSLALKAAGDPTRTRILKLLEGGPLCVCQVQAVLALAASTVSKHLATLKTAGLVEDHRSGRWIQYGLSSPPRLPLAGAVLELVRGSLDQDPVILADRKRLRQVLAVPLDELCSVMPARVSTPRVSRPRRTRRQGRQHG